MGSVRRQYSLPLHACRLHERAHMKEKKREPEKPTIVEQHSSSTVDRRGERDPRMMKAVLRDKVDASKKKKGKGVHRQVPQQEVVLYRQPKKKTLERCWR